MIALGINLVMTVIGFAVSTVFIVFVCTRLICVRIHLSSSRRSFPTASRYDLSLVERGLHGVEPVVVATFPTKKFGDEFFSFGEDAQCTVCLVEYQEKDILRILPYCGHSFHITCIDKWLQQHSTCPVCRISLHDSPKRKRMIQPMFSSFVQSPYGVDSLDSNSSHCLYSSHGFSSSAVDNRRMESIQEDQYTSEVDATEARESVASLTEDNRAPKDPCLHKLENKQVALSNL